MSNQTISDKTISTLNEVWQVFLQSTPDFIAGFVLVLTGWLCAFIIKKIITKGLNKFQLPRLLDAIGLTDLLQKTGFQITGSQIIASLFSTFVFLLFFLAALDTLGLTILSGLIDTLTLFLPKILAAFFVMIFGFFVGQIVFKSTKFAAKNAGIDYGRSLAEVCRGIIIVITLSLAITQLEVDVSLLNTIISVITASVGLAAAISLGIGTKTMSKEIVSGVYLRDLYKVGDLIRVDDIEGNIVSISSATSRVITESGDIITIPNTFLLGNKTTKISPKPQARD
ncbi:hypothetical protein PULV_a2528 [Pseudoalteromonas ulvae UL12]|uniref:mechanosensitive ion channel family protein n=1 Tax=Pseudoalteromonas ulvae TaxID=107327 RepID=UPI00186B9F3D|nr:mechanosensitive ion channel domain-containing protein [Pseudoalteromonas ulvae]MBE0364765.1 hypothetical protein [Pseudoalteromonas ulvae UL12]